MTNLLIVLGSTREGRNSEKVGKWVEAQAKLLKDVKVDLVDLREVNLPLFDRPMPPVMVKDGNYGDKKVNDWAKRVEDADAYLFITPEYNHSYPPVLKNALDHVGGEWAKKPASFVAYGVSGGSRSVEHLRGVLANLQVAVSSEALFMSLFTLPFDETGQLNDESYNEKLAKVFDQLLWWSGALSLARSSKN